MLFFSFGNRAFNKEFSESNIYVVVSPKYEYEDELSFLDKADYLFVANKKIRRSEKIERKYGDNYPNYKREFISDKIADKVKYVALFRSGLGFYDVYEVIKK
jgi:hypothetical protein